MDGVGINGESTRASRRHPKHRVGLVLLPLGLALAAVVLSSCSLEVMQIVNLTKQDRDDAGVAPLEYNAALGDKAQALADQMCDTGKLGHSRLGDGVDYPWKSLAENIGYGKSLDEINAKWIDDAAYASNITSKRFTHLGVGACQADDGTWFAVQEFMQL